MAEVKLLLSLVMFLVIFNMISAVWIGSSVDTGVSMPAAPASLNILNFAGYIFVLGFAIVKMTLLSFSFLPVWITLIMGVINLTIGAIIISLLWKT